MLKVSNQRCIRRLSIQTMKASKTRNKIAILAIALTAMLFTSLFTIVMSINDGMQQATFRQVGGYSHATFKYMTKEQYEDLKIDTRFKEVGLRRFIGMPKEEPFHKTHVEIGYSDATQAHWMYCDPVEGRLPTEGTMEAATDLDVLALLGVTPKLGEKFSITFDVAGVPTTQEFTLCGWWESDSASTAHMVMIPESRVNDILEETGNTAPASDGQTGAWGMDVMFNSSMHIQKDVEEVLLSHGYQLEGALGDENYITTGVNWGYSSAQFVEKLDAMSIVMIGCVLALIVFTGYLIIYNVFQISVSNDIRFYGLLKTIGTTPKQLKRIIRLQAWMLSAIGIPIGLFLGWLIGAKLSPVVIAELNGVYEMVSVNPAIFAGAAVFSVLTVHLSCSRPEKLAAKVSPIEAVRFTEGNRIKAKMKKTGTVSVYMMAKENLKRSRGKTIVTVVSMSLAVVLLNVMVICSNGFDMDKYVSKFYCTDFVLADASYFQVSNLFSKSTEVEDEAVQEIEKIDGVQQGGKIYGCVSAVQEFVAEAYMHTKLSKWNSADEIDSYLAWKEKTSDGLIVDSARLYGMEPFALEQLHVYEGDVSKLNDKEKRYVAAVYHEDDYGNLNTDSHWAKVGDTITLRYVKEYEYYDMNTGETLEDFDETTDSNVNWNVRAKIYEDVTYEVVAKVVVPHAISYRYYGTDEFIMGADRFIQDTETNSVMLYCFDVEDEKEQEVEAYLADSTTTKNNRMDYESKFTYAAEFESFRSMFGMLGGVLSFVVGFVGILNFFNAVLTGIISRKREFAVLQSIGMTGKQLKQMLVCEGVLYAIMTVALSLCVLLASGKMIGSVLESVLWFFTYQFTVMPIVVVAPVFAILGCVIPLGVYYFIAKMTVVERLRYME